jgi:predicted DsbA family dithiol-disulfide isomerase
MRIEFVFDTICPWCYIGKSRLVDALRQRSNVPVSMRWTPFILNPKVPFGGVERAPFLTQKLGGESRLQRLNKSIVEAACMDQIPIDLAKIKTIPNALNSHRLIRYAALYNLEEAAIDQLFAAYFVGGIDIGNIEILIDLGHKIGLSPPDLRTYLLDSDESLPPPTEEVRKHRLGINGVPCIIFEGRFAISGAQEADVLLHLFDLAYENLMEPIETNV